MRFSRDDRSQAIQIGAVLIFGILIVFLSLYQGFVVPDQNEGIEFDHNQELQSEMTELRGEVISMPGTSTTQSSSVTLGVRYPSRAIFVNPGPSSGTLQTTGTTDSAINLTIENATVEGNTGDYWDGTSKAYNTGAIEYRPSYNLYATAPRTVYEHSVVYNSFGTDTTLPLSGQAIVRDDRITVVALNGSFSENRVDSVSVDVEPVSTDTRTVEIENESHPVTLSVPTAMNRTQWEDVFEEELTENGGNVADVSTADIESLEGLSMLELELEPGTYSLQMAKVGVGTGISEPKATYITDVAGDGAITDDGQTRTFAVEVRDKFNNPVRNVEVFADADRGTLDEDSVETDSDGQAVVEYTAPETAGEDSIEFSFAGEIDDGFDARSPENLSMAVTVRESTTAGDGASAYNTSWQEPHPFVEAIDDIDGIEYNEDDDIYEFNATETSRVDMEMWTDPSADDASVEFATSETETATVDPAFNRTTADGTAETTLEPQREGQFNVYTWSGGTGDSVAFDVVDIPDGEFQNLVLDVEPDTAGDDSVHNWSFTNAEFDGDVDTITLDYSDSGASFDGLDEDDVTVFLTREGDDEPIEIDVNQDDYSGTSATFDLSGQFNTDVDGPGYVEVDGLENPANADEYDAEIEFDGDEDTVSGEATFEIVEEDVTQPAIDTETSAIDPNEVTEGDEDDYVATVELENLDDVTEDGNEVTVTLVEYDGGDSDIAESAVFDADEIDDDNTVTVSVAGGSFDGVTAPESGEYDVEVDVTFADGELGDIEDEVIDVITVESVDRGVFAVAEEELGNGEDISANFDIATDEEIYTTTFELSRNRGGNFPPGQENIEINGFEAQLTDDAREDIAINLNVQDILNPDVYDDPDDEFVSLLEDIRNNLDSESTIENFDDSAGDVGLDVEIEPVD